MDNRTRTRLLLLVAFVIVVAAVGVVLLLSTQGGDEEAAATPEVIQATAEDPDEATAVPTEEGATPIPTQALTQIVVAVQNIPRGAEIPPDAVRLQPFPLEAAPFNAITDPEEIIGRIARTDFFVEQPILSNMVVDTLDQLAEEGSDAAAVMPPGRVAVSVPMDRITSVSYALQPGDRVDLVVSLLFVDMDEQFQSVLPNNVNLLAQQVDLEAGSISLGPGAPVNGRFDTRRIPLIQFDTVNQSYSNTSIDFPVIISPSEEARPRLLTQRTVLDAQVLFTGDAPIDGRLFAEVPSPTPVQPTADPNQPGAAQGQQGQAPPVPTSPPPRPDIVTLAVTPQEAVTIIWLIEARVPITFLLRAASDRQLRPTDAVTLDYIIGEYDITVPRRNEFTIQPAIRSIRQLIGGGTITFSN
jgi:pilus assembly protein CpaB